MFRQRQRIRLKHLVTFLIRCGTFDHEIMKTKDGNTVLGDTEFQSVHAVRKRCETPFDWRGVCGCFKLSWQRMEAQRDARGCGHLESSFLHLTLHFLATSLTTGTCTVFVALGAGDLLPDWRHGSCGHTLAGIDGLTGRR